MRGAWLSLAAVLTACGGAVAIDERAIEPTRRVPVAAEWIALPPGSTALGAWMGPRGDGLIALRGGGVLAIDARAHARAIDGVPGDATIDAPVIAFADRGDGDPVALVPGGLVGFPGGLARRSRLPAFLDAASALARVGDEAMWGTPAGLYASTGDAWIGVELGTGPLRGVSAIVPLGSADAWVLASSSLYRVRLEPPSRVTWLDPAPGVALGAVAAIAGLGGARAAAMTGSAVTLVSPDRITRFHADERDGGPQVLGGGGGWAWVGWAGQILRTDGARWESLASGIDLGAGSRIAVDGAAGAAALVVDARGRVLRIEAEDALRSAGLAPGAVVVDTRLDLEVLSPRSDKLARVSFAVDGNEIAVRTEAPWGWGEGGARARDVASISFGPHAIEIRARFASGRELAQSVPFVYRSPLGRVPSYERDIAPLVKARCSRCHGSGIARDLSGYGAMSAQATLVRASVREGRMPPDLLLDPAGVALFTAWADGDTPL